MPHCDRIDKELCDFVDKVEDRIQNKILTAIPNIINQRIDLAVKFLNASPGRDAASATSDSERRDHIG